MVLPVAHTHRAMRKLKPFKPRGDLGVGCGKDEIATVDPSSVVQLPIRNHHAFVCAEQCAAMFDMLDVAVFNRIIDIWRKNLR